MVLWAAAALGDTLAPVGMRQLEFRDRDRRLSLTVFYPAEKTGEADLFAMPFYVGLELHREAPLLMPRTRRPLVMLSHGRGSNALVYAWFAQYLAARGYVVAAIDHYPPTATTPPSPISPTSYGSGRGTSPSPSPSC